MSVLTHALILADALPSIGSTRNFKYCIKINNLAKYPNHLLFAQIASQNANIAASPYILITTDRCLDMNGYRPIANIVAIPKNKVTNKDLKVTKTETTLNNPKLQKSPIKIKEPIYAPSSMPIINEGKNIQGIYEIKSIGKAELQLMQVDDLAITNIIIFPLIGATILGWILWKRRQNKVTQ
jgi:hypothetical protein